MTIAIHPAPVSGRAVQLRENTHSAHGRLDKRIIAGAPFQDRGRYGLFLQVQYIFHRNVDVLYTNEALGEMLPGLPDRRRFSLVVQDMRDLAVAIPDETQRVLLKPSDLPLALGWLYVAEGSNLGAAFLLKEAYKLGLDENFGARHLAAHDDGRGLHWRHFTSALDAVPLSTEEEVHVIEGANEAFSFVQAQVEQLLPLPLKPD